MIREIEQQFTEEILMNGVIRRLNDKPGTKKFN